MRKTAEYTNRPLTEEEKEFSAAPENYDLFFKYMRIHKLDPEEWYDILILDYLRAVKKYLSIPRLQEYEFGAILFKTLDTGRGNYFRAMNTQKRRSEGGLVSLDYTIESDNSFSRQRVEEWFVDRNASVERQIIFKELFKEFYAEISEDRFFGENDRWLLDLILNGYEMKELVKRYEARYGKCNPDDWWGSADYINYMIEGRFRSVFKKVFGI